MEKIENSVQRRKLLKKEYKKISQKGKHVFLDCRDTWVLKTPNIGLTKNCDKTVFGKWTKEGIFKELYLHVPN